MEVEERLWVWEHSSFLELMGRCKVWVSDRPQIPLAKVKDCSLATNRTALAA